MNMNKKVFMGIAATAMAMASIGVASAAFVTDWEYDNRAGFTAWAPEDVVESEEFRVLGEAFESPPGALGPDLVDSDNNAFGTLRWGDPVGTTPSGLVSGQRAVGEIETGDGVFGDPASGVSLTHENFVITGDSLSTATLKDVIYIRSKDCDTCDTFETAVDFEIAFLETPNLGSGSTAICANGLSRQDPLNAAGCADIFVVTAPLELIVGDFIEIPVAPGDGYLYTFRIGAVGLGQINQTACRNALGDSTYEGTCLGWLTSENQTNTLNTFFQVKAELIPVPAPATMLLFGAGLLALGATVRRRRT